MVYVVVALIALVVLYFLFIKKSDATPVLPPEEADEPKLPAPKKATQPREERRAEPAPPAKQPAPAPKAAAAPEPAPAPKAEPVRAEAAAPAEPPAPAPPPPPSRQAERAVRGTPGVEGYRRGLGRSRGEEGFFGRLKALFTGPTEIAADLSADIEEVLLASDVGVATTQTLLGRVRESLGSRELSDSGRVWDALRNEARRILSVDGRAGSFRLSGKPTVVLLVGVNGAGKTTTIGKLAAKLKGEGRTVVLAAGDTFRAAAVQQLTVWGERVGCEVVKGKDGADPGSVIFDAIKRATDLGADVVLADTAGRLHTKSNLMAEMKKVVKNVNRAMDGAPHEVLLVLDATNGQNALAQAKEFKEALDVTGLVLTKLDGTAKGGVVLGICDELALPVRFVGLGERPDDLQPFSADEFVEALLGAEAAEEAA